jgi:hypothetical protein
MARLKGLRKLQNERQQLNKKDDRRDIIQEYGNYASRVYVPKQRDGLLMDKNKTTVQVKLDELHNYHGTLSQLIPGLVELESKLPKSLFSVSHELSSTNPSSRKDKLLKDQLERMNQKLVERKEKQQLGDQPIQYAVRIEKPPPRPITPSIAVPGEEDEEMEVAAFILQNTLRGRFVQHQMHQRKTRFNM